MKMSAFEGKGQLDPTSVPEWPFIKPQRGVIFIAQGNALGGLVSQTNSQGVALGFIDEAPSGLRPGTK